MQVSVVDDILISEKLIVILCTITSLHSESSSFWSDLKKNFSPSASTFEISQRNRCRCLLGWCWCWWKIYDELETWQKLERTRRREVGWHVMVNGIIVSWRKQEARCWEQDDLFLPPSLPFFFFFFSFVFLSFCRFLGPLLQHMEVPRLGVQSEL